MSGNFKYSRWDPTLISSQIVAIQSTYYISLGFVLYLFSHLSGHVPTLDQLFNYQVILFDFLLFAIMMLFVTDG